MFLAFHPGMMFPEGMALAHTSPTAALHALFSARTVILDGAMGSLIQTYQLGEADFRG